LGLCIAAAARGKGPCAHGAGSRCPSIESVSASPDPTAAGARFELSATIAYDGAAGAISFDWHLVSGSVGALVADPATGDATFACTAIGREVVELTRRRPRLGLARLPDRV